MAWHASAAGLSTSGRSLAVAHTARQQQAAQARPRPAHALLAFLLARVTVTGARDRNTRAPPRFCPIHELAFVFLLAPSPSPPRAASCSYKAAINPTAEPGKAASAHPSIRPSARSQARHARSAPAIPVDHGELVCVPVWARVTTQAYSASQPG